MFPVLKKFEASLCMGIYEDWQIHTKTSFRPIKLQESRSGPHTNQTPSNNGIILVKLDHIFIMIPWGIQSTKVDKAQAYFHYDPLGNTKHKGRQDTTYNDDK